MNELILQVFSIFQVSLVQTIVILGVILAIFIEISKILPFTKSTWDDTVVAKIITEIKEWIDILTKIASKISELIFKIVKK